MASIADTARSNMLSALVLTEPRLESNADLMRLVIGAGGASIITPTDASVGTQLLRYMMSLRG